MFSAILSNHFSDAHFYKATGDGLLLIHELPSKSQQVPAVVSSILSRCLTLVDEFGQITADDYMINFQVPQKLGAGVARGSVTRLVSDGGVLDYTGRCLNLAARLMDKARPSGVVFSDTHAAHLMNAEVSLLFSQDRVCIRGISEQEPIPIYISSGVEITRSDREPVPEGQHVWGDEMTRSVAEVRDSSSFSFWLPRAPRSYERVGVHVKYPLFDRNGNRTHNVSWFVVYGEHEEQPEGDLVRIDMKSVKERIRGLPATTTGKILGLTKKTDVTFTPFCEAADDA